MPWKKASIIKLSEKQRKILEDLNRGTHTEMHFIKRSSIILMAANNEKNDDIERELKISPQTVRLWRDKYSSLIPELEKTEKENPNKLREMVKQALSDEQRLGAPPKFKDEQVALIIAMSCEEPEKYGLSISNWTPELLRLEAIKLGIVDTISIRQVGRFLKSK